MEPKLELVRIYLECGGTICPFCESDNIVGKAVVIEEGKATQPVSCNECNEEWVSTYVLSSISVVDKTYDAYDAAVSDNDGRRTP